MAQTSSNALTKITMGNSVTILFTDFKVTGIGVKIIDAAGVEAEVGPCQLDTLGIWWEYTTSQEVILDPGVEMKEQYTAIISVFQYPFHSGREQSAYRFHQFYNISLSRKD